MLQALMEEVAIQYKRILRFKALLHLQKEDNFELKKNRSRVMISIICLKFVKNSWKKPYNKTQNNLIKVNSVSIRITLTSLWTLQEVISIGQQNLLIVQQFFRFQDLSMFRFFPSLILLN